MSRRQAAGAGRLILRGGLVAVLAGLGAASSSAQTSRDAYSGSYVRIEASGGDINAAGASVLIRGQAGDVNAAGAAVDIRATIAKNVNAAGARVIIDSVVAGKVSAGAGVVEVRGQIEGEVSLGGAVVRFDGISAGDVNLGGAIVDVGPAAQIGGRLNAGAAVLNVEGHIAGEVRIGGAVVTFNASADGPVTIDGDQVVIGSRAVVPGDLIVYSNNDPAIETGASISGQVKRMPPHEWWRLSGWAWKGLFAVAMALGTLLAGLILLFAARGSFDEAVDRSTRRPVSSVLIGLATLILLPIVAAAIMVTIIGISFGLALLLLLPFILVVGHTVLATTVGAWIFGQRGIDRSFAASFGMLVIGAIVVAGIWMIPWAGPTIATIGMLIGVGAFFRTFLNRLYRRPEPAF